MGGIALDMSKLIDNEDPKRVHPHAIRFLAHEGAFVDIPSAMISDKSKANLLGKGLVCIQVLWFVIQCIARKVSRYPLVLLEIHTMVHVICALLMYVLWWKVRLGPSKNVYNSSQSRYRNHRISPNRRFTKCPITWTI